VQLHGLAGIISIDREGQRATVRAGTPIHQLGRLLWDHGLALRNQGDIDRQAIGGALGTGTHGTGRSLPCLSAEIEGFRLVTASGEVLTCTPSENAEIFEAGRVSFGAFGIMTDVTLGLRPRHALHVEERIVPVAEAIASFEALSRRHRHVEFFWFPYADAVLLKTLSDTDATPRAPRSLEAMAARGARTGSAERLFDWGCRVIRFMPSLTAPIHRFFTDNAAEPDRVRWSHEAFPSARSIRFNEMEYAVPAAQGLDCLQELVSAVRQKRIATGFPFEFRLVRGDTIPLSPFEGGDRCTIAVHQHHRHPGQVLFSLAESIFRRYGGRPHWGKLHSLEAAAFEALYPAFGRVRSLRRRLDPKGRFLNAHLAAIFGEDTGAAR